MTKVRSPRVEIVSRSEGERQNVEILYQELSINWRYFLDWRHRAMERLFLSLGAIAVAAGWLLNAKDYKILFAAPLLASGLFLMVALMENRTVVVVTKIEDVAGDLERMMRAEGGFFVHYPRRGTRPRSYSQIFRGAYRGGFVVCLMLSALLFWRFASWTSLF